MHQDNTDPPRCYGGRHARKADGGSQRECGEKFLNFPEAGQFNIGHDTALAQFSNEWTGSRDAAGTPTKRKKPRIPTTTTPLSRPRIVKIRGTSRQTGPPRRKRRWRETNNPPAKFPQDYGPTPPLKLRVQGQGLKILTVPLPQPRTMLRRLKFRKPRHPRDLKDPCP